MAEQIVAKHYTKLGIGNIRKSLQMKLDTWNRLRLAGKTIPLNTFIHRPGQRVLLKRPYQRKKHNRTEDPAWIVMLPALWSQ